MTPTILIIAQAFPPDSLVGALRAGNVARAYRDAGYRVLVITATLDGEVAGEREWLPGVTVKTVSLGPRYRDRLNTLLRKWQSRGRRSVYAPTAALASGGASPVGAQSSGRLRSLIRSLVWIPDDELRFVLPAYRAARQVLEGVDLVYTTAPPHSTNLVGLLLRSLHRIRWCAEFRDPWCHPHSVPVTPLVGRVNGTLERLCIKAANHLVTVTERTASLYRQRLGSSGGKVLMVRNGIPTLNPRQRQKSDESFRIVYGGTIFGGRDTGTFLQAVRAVVGDYSAAGKALRVDLFLKEPGGRQVSVEAYIRGFGLADIARVHQSVPHMDMQRIVAESDLLLLLAQGQPLQVPNKLYEYLGTGVPILAVADADGETARLLHAVGGHYVVERDTADAIASALRSALIASGGAGNVASPHLLEEWLTERQMQRLVSAIRP